MEEFVRVNKKHSWVLPKPKLGITKFLVIAVLPLLLASCTERLAEQDIWFWLKATLGSYVVYRILKYLGSGGGRNSDGGGD